MPMIVRTSTIGSRFCRLILASTIVLVLIGAQPLAVAGSRGESEKSEIDFPIIDIHSHMFNLNYLPVNGIAHAIINQKTDKVPRFFRWAIVRLLNNTHDAEYIKIPVQTREHIEVYPFKVPKEMRLGKVLSMGDWFATLIAGHVLGRFGVLGEQPGRARNYVRTYRTLRLSEAETFNEAKRRVDDRISLFVHHMMDMDLAYHRKGDAEPKYPFIDSQNSSRDGDQIRRMQSLVETYQGSLLTFTAYDPFRDDPNRLDDQLAIEAVKTAVKHGAIGVKFYPPSGYRASGNKIPPRACSALKSHWDSRYKGWTNKNLDETIDAFFAYCADVGLPVFTHCTSSGVQADKCYGWNSDPEYFVEILEKYPNLILCFGHGGGYKAWHDGEAWHLDTGPNSNAGKSRTPKDPSKICGKCGNTHECPTGDKSWEQKVAELCMTYKNVYCGFGYHMYLLKGKERSHLAARLQRLFDHSTKDGLRPFSEKILYGTDWHMPNVVRRPKKYLNRSLKLFDDFPPDMCKTYKRAFFAGNAANYLQLAEVADKKMSISKNVADKLSQLLIEICKP